MTELSDERAERRTYIRHRQTLVFSLVAFVLCVTLTVSMLFFFHAFGLGLQRGTAVQPNYGSVAPCAPKDKDGNPQTYVSNEKISARVQNGTKFAGLAKAVSEAMQNRHFVVATVASYPVENVDRTIIYFGRNAIAEAYSVDSNFTDARMVMDDRKDKLVDVVIGATFNDLVDEKKVPAAGSKITSIEGCQDAASMTNLPKAIKHDSVG